MRFHFPRRFLVLLLSILLIMLPASAAIAAETPTPASAQGTVSTATETSGTYEVNLIDEVWTMSDGITLPVSVFNPVPKSADEKFPVIIAVHGWAGDKSMSGWTAEYYAKKGYIGVAMTCRGWFGAGGEIGCMDPEHDMKDVSDIITLVAQDKRFPVLKDDKGPIVGITGYSMGGCYSYMMAPRKNPRPGDPCDPRIRAVVPMHGSFDLVFALYPNDALKILLASMLLGGAYMGNMSAFMMSVLSMATDANTDDWQKMSSVTQALFTLIQQPINNVTPGLMNIYSIATQRIVEREQEAKQYIKLRSARYWCDEEYDGKIEHPITAPMLIITGFNDDLFFANEGLMAFNSAVGPKRIIITKAGHGGDASITSGGRFPLDDEAKWKLQQVDNWFDHYLKGVDNGVEKEAPISYYRAEDPANFGQANAYPLPGTSQTSYYLDTDTSGAGKLATSRAKGGSQDLLFNIGLTGSISLPHFQDIGGMFGMGISLDYPSKMNLFDIPFTEQSYTTAPLTKDVTIMGAPKVAVYYQSSQAYTQLDPCIYEVAPDGTETVVSWGWYEGHNSQSWSTVDTASQPIEMIACYHRFKAGNRIKLEIATADLTSALPIFTPTLIWLFHNKKMPSRLMLPVVPNTN